MHKIKPTTIRKNVRDIMEGARSTSRGRLKYRVRNVDKYRGLTPEQIESQLDSLEKTMFSHARDLDFEKAAQLRDEIALVRQERLRLP